MPDSPNILVIMSDQHNPHVLGCAGDAVVRTPNLDRLAAGGVYFTDAYCQSPLCVPARMSFLTARQCSDIRVWSNRCILSSEIATFVHGLGVAGYETILCGRMHFVGPDQRHGFHRRIIGDVDASLGHIPRFTTGQSRPAVEVAGPGRTAYSAYDDAVTQTCCEFLRARGRTGGERPFFMTVGYVLPHCPYICPKHLFDEYYGKVDVPRLPPGYLEGLHPAVRLWRERRGVDELSDEQVRTARAAYYGLVTYTDERVGDVLQALEESGLAEDTIVVYTTDHGDMAGEHRMWWKSSLYEGSVGVPLIFSWPGRFARGRRVGDVTSLVDVGPTLLDLVGADPLPFATGRSLAGLLREHGEEARVASHSALSPSMNSGPRATTSGSWPKGNPWHTGVAFSEYCGLLGDRPAVMVRKGPWKLNHYQGYEVPQLFNLKEDPGEVRDRASDPACAGVREELMGIVRENWRGDVVERATQQRQAEAELFVKWRKTLPPGLGSQHVVQEKWKAPPDCNVFPEAAAPPPARFE